jgi:hypothetical protein
MSLWDRQLVEGKTPSVTAESDLGKMVHDIDGEGIYSWGIAFPKCLGFVLPLLLCMNMYIFIGKLCIQTNKGNFYV